MNTANEFVALSSLLGTVSQDATAEIEGEVEDQDPRSQPHYSLTHVQNVSSEDMYLGMSGKTPSFSHADQFLLK
ncbi:hypothetical protein HDU91_000799, partial [Kappamyces sp. JEL0680]